VRPGIWVCTNRVQRLLPSFALRDHLTRTWIPVPRSSAGILSLIAVALMIGCAGVSTSTRTVTETGTGTGPSTHTVDLSWTASTSADVSGYNIYRAVYINSCGPFSKINSVLITSTWYTDSEVKDGTSYCYATTAVDMGNRESGYSNVVTDIQIPAS